jgi:protocatechuate 4,5-dioxygenase alpha subunit
MTPDEKRNAPAAAPSWETGVEILPIKSRLIDFEKPIAGTYLTTGARAQRGYRLSKFCMAFMSPAFRERFKAEPEGVMREFGLSDYEKALIRERNFNAMVRYGVNAFMIFKLANAFGIGQNRTGAMMRRQTYEDFMATRNVKDAS